MSVAKIGSTFSDSSFRQTQKNFPLKHEQTVEFLNENTRKRLLEDVKNESKKQKRVHVDADVLAGKGLTLLDKLSESLEFLNYEEKDPSDRAFLELEKFKILALFNKALEINPLCVEALKGRGLFYSILPRNKEFYALAYNDFLAAEKMISTAQVMEEIIVAKATLFYRYFKFKEARELKPLDEIPYYASRPSLILQSISFLIEHFYLEEAALRIKLFSDKKDLSKRQKIELLLNQASLYFHTGHLKFNAECLKDVVLLDPSNQEVHFHLVYSAVEADFMDLAQACFDELEKNESPRFFLIKGIFFLKKGTEEKDQKKREEYLSLAEMAFEKTLKMDPLNLLALIYKASIEKNFHSAVNAFCKAISLNNRFAITFQFRGIFFKKHHHYQEALRDFDTALQLNPFHVPTYRLRASVYHIIGNLNAVCEDLKMGLTIIYSNYSFFYLADQTLFDLGNIYVEMKNFVLAEECFRIVSHSLDQQLAQDAINKQALVDLSKTFQKSPLGN